MDPYRRMVYRWVDRQAERRADRQVKRRVGESEVCGYCSSVKLSEASG